MKRPPEGWPRIAPILFYDDPRRALGFLADAFGFEPRRQVEGPGGRLEQAELTLPEGLVLVAQTGAPGGDEAEPWRARQQSPHARRGTTTQSVCVWVDDVDAHCARARQHGAMVVEEPRLQDRGPGAQADRRYGALDPEGHLWWFLQRLPG